MKKAAAALALCALLLSACGEGAAPDGALERAEAYALSEAESWNESGEEEGWRVSGWDVGELTAVKAGTHGCTFYTFAPTLTFEGEGGALPGCGEAYTGQGPYMLYDAQGRFLRRISDYTLDDIYHGNLDAAADAMYERWLEFQDIYEPDGPRVKLDCDVSGVPGEVTDYFRGYVSELSAAYNDRNSVIYGIEPLGSADAGGRSVDFYALDYSVAGRAKGEPVCVPLLKDGDGFVYLRERNDSPFELETLPGGGYDFDGAAQKLLAGYDAMRRAGEVEFAAPEGIDMSGFDITLGTFGGWASKQTAWERYGVEHGERSESVAAVTVEALDSRFAGFTDGAFPEAYAFGNHHWYEDGEPVEIDGCTAIVCRRRCDLLIGSDFTELWERGYEWDELYAGAGAEGARKVDAQSDYWTVYLTRPGDGITYQLSLAANRFTRGDALEFAGSFRYKW